MRGATGAAGAILRGLLAISLAACAAELQTPPPPADVSFVADQAAFRAPAAGAPVPFDVVASDMDLDGDTDLLINWHNLARLELFENVDGAFELRNPADDDRSGLRENPGIDNLYAQGEEVVRRARAAGVPGVFVWHEPDPRRDWHFLVIPDRAPATIELRANRPMTPRLDERFVRRRGEFDASLAIDAETRFRVEVEFVATQLNVRASLPVFVGAQLDEVGDVADLWKGDPHGMAWVDVRGSREPDLFLTRGGLMGNLVPPHDPKRDRFYEYQGGEQLFRDARGLLPLGYGRGRSVEWVDIDGDSGAELYIGNTESANAVLSFADGRFKDVAAELGLGFRSADTFAWIDIDGEGGDDLVFIDPEGFGIAYNRSGGFELRRGSEVGLRFPPASTPDVETLFATLSLNVVDADSDGRLDLWLTGHGEERGHALYRGTGERFEEITTDAGLAGAPLANSILFLDVDNDGYQDALTFGLVICLLRNRGGSFEVVPLSTDLGLREFSRAVALDADGDGLLDVAVAGPGRRLLRNQTTGAGRALRVRLVSRGGDPVGAVVSAVYSNGVVQAQRFGSARNTQYSQGLAPLHYGIPHGSTVERLLIRWPDGEQEERDVGADENFIELVH